MKIAIIITHNKTDQENFDQIEQIKTLTTSVIDDIPVFDDGGKQIDTIQSSHYEILNLGIPHELIFYQILPVGVTQPKNFYSIDSAATIYTEKSDLTSNMDTHYFNCGLLRGTDLGADIVIHLQDPSQLQSTDIVDQLNQLSIINPAPLSSSQLTTNQLSTDQATIEAVSTDTEYINATWGIFSTIDLLKQTGTLDENLDRDTALLAYQDTGILTPAVEITQL